MAARLLFNKGGEWGKRDEAEMKLVDFIGVEFARGRGLVPSHNPQTHQFNFSSSIQSNESFNLIHLMEEEGRELKKREEATQPTNQ